MVQVYQLKVFIQPAHPLPHHNILHLFLFQGYQLLNWLLLKQQLVQSP